MWVCARVSCVREVKELIYSFTAPLWIGSSVKRQNYGEEQQQDESLRIFFIPLFIQGYPTIVFCKVSACSEKQILPRILYCLRQGRKFLDDRSIHVQILETYLLNSLQFSEALNNFPHFTPRPMLFFVEKENLKFSYSVMIEIGIRKILTFIKR